MKSFCRLWSALTITALAATGCSLTGGGDDEGEDDDGGSPTEVVLVTHESFNLPES